MNAVVEHQEEQAVLPKAEDTTYVLQELEVFNWGPFEGMHRSTIDPAGTAIIGPTGSGKTTLIDGLMTLLVQQPKYNLASTGGHESDRTLISYVRGILGGDGSSEREEVARPGKTWTGLCATYHDGREVLKLAAIFWTEGASNAAQDLKRKWIFSQAAGESLEAWLRLAHGDGVRHLTRHGKETARLRIFDSKKAYLAHVRKFFDVGENAFTLLNRAAGLKQLNSIDEIFRDLVLDDHSQFDRALEVAGEFDNLAGIHTELETALRQQESLSPIADEFQKLSKAREHEVIWATLKRVLPIWFAITGEQRWSEVVEKLTLSHDEYTTRLTEEERLRDECNGKVETLLQAYLRLGGDVIGQLQKTIEEQTSRVADRRRHAEDYQRFAAEFDLNAELTESALQSNQAVLQERRPEMEQNRESKQEEALKAHSRLREEEERAAEVENNIHRVKDRPGSNIPPKFQDFRTALAGELGVADEDLPYVAELVEVKPEEGDWRGAIERAIGSERLRVLVPEQHMDAALRWVNDRDNRLHVRLLCARLDARPGEFFADGFTRKLNFKQHPLREELKRLLAGRDRHCVASPEELRHTEHGMTIQGLMSDRRGRFEKQDQRRLDEGWMTGFDNRDQLRELARQLTALNSSVEEWRGKTKSSQVELNQLDAQLRMVDGLIELEFSRIDLPGAESDLSASKSRLEALQDPESDAGKAKGRYEQANAELNLIQERIKEIEKNRAKIEERRDRAKKRCDEAVQRKGDGLTDEELTLAQQKLPIASDVSAEDLDTAERDARDKTENKLGNQQERVKNHEQRLIRLMEGAQKADTGALAETGTELEDIPDYLDRLRVLNEEALPEKRGRFLDYLNRSSDQGVTQLLAGISEEVDAIEQRIRELNLTLTKVDFRNGRYLQLQPQRIQHELIRTLDRAQRRLRSAALKADEDQGELQYKALQSVVEILRGAGENRRQLGSRALLDPRYRLQFYVVEVNRSTGERSAPRTGSQSGSGGEKELMASHILTASLSYALCPVEAKLPLYGTVVLDEAFSKSSPSAAGRIIEALRIFGLHPIFVTPNKEIGLLKKHTRKVICVQRPGKRASLASISWEKLEEIARPK